RGRAMRTGRGGGGRAADTRLPLPPDRSAGGGGQDGPGDEYQKGTVPRPLGHEAGRAQGRSLRQPPAPAVRARRQLRLQHPDLRHARPAHPGGDRLPRGFRCDPFGAAAGRPRKLDRWPARVRARARPRRGGGGPRRRLYGDSSGSLSRPVRRAEHGAGPGHAPVAGSATGLRSPGQGRLARMLIPHLQKMARNNAWSNYRLYGACARLSEAEFRATRVSFFPTIALTLSHILTVDWYYIDA